MSCNPVICIRIYLRCHYVSRNPDGSRSIGPVLNVSDCNDSRGHEIQLYTFDIDRKCNCIWIPAWMGNTKTHCNDVETKWVINEMLDKWQYTIVTQTNICDGVIFHLTATRISSIVIVKDWFSTYFSNHLADIHEFIWREAWLYCRCFF